MSYVKEVNHSDFDKVRQSSLPALVDFWAPWCGPCKAIGPIIEKFAESNKAEVEVYKVNVDNNTDLATEFNISSIPTLLLFKKGKVVETMIGVIGSDKELKEKVQVHL